MHQATKFEFSVGNRISWSFDFLLKKTLLQSYDNENKNYHTVGTVPKYNRNIVERGKIVPAFYILDTLDLKYL